MTSPLPVLIIGAGLGGLTLAHALHNRSIPFHVYERDSAASTRTQGYRISLDGMGVTGLRHALTDEVFERFERTVGEAKMPAGRVDARSGKVRGRGLLAVIGAGGAGMMLSLLGRYVRGRNWARWVPFSSAWSAKEPLTLPGPHVDARYPVDRGVLRTILLESLPEGSVTFDAPFSSYTLADNAVTVHFSNPSLSPVTGSFLVATDGVSSRVAAQLVGPSSAPLDLDTSIVYGKTPLAPLIEAGLHESLKEGISFVTDEEGAAGEGKRILLVCEAMRFDRETGDKALPEEDYFFWALTAPRNVFSRPPSSSPSPSEEEEETPSALSLRLTSSWHPSLRPIFTLTNPSTSAFLRLSTSRPLPHAPSWKTDHRVTLLGDAVHAMPPTGGAGANTALWDAALLGLALGKAKEEKGEGQEGKGWSEETIKVYEEGMRYNVGDIVGLAYIGVEGLVGARKAVK
ncbi:hypothetical protein JCM8547_008993 [Rhodosporidiobolus lusitaniae]